MFSHASLRAALAAGLILSVFGPTRAAELAADAWPQFRRDAGRTGDNPQARLAFPLTRTTAVRLPAPIYASPAVVAGRVYVQDARGNDPLRSQEGAGNALQAPVDHASSATVTDYLNFKNREFNFKVPAKDHHHRLCYDRSTRRRFPAHD